MRSVFHRKCALKFRKLQSTRKVINYSKKIVENWFLLICARQIYGKLDHTAFFPNMVEKLTFSRCIQINPLHISQCRKHGGSFDITYIIHKYESIKTTERNFWVNIIFQMIYIISNRPNVIEILYMEND